MLVSRTPKHKGQVRSFIAPAYSLAKKVMPKISETEAAALESGTIAFDADLFEGTANVKDLVKRYQVKLTAEEQSFMDNEVETLCEMLDSYKIGLDQNLSPEAWKYIREKKFMGMVRLLSTICFFHTPSRQPFFAYSDLLLAKSSLRGSVCCFLVCDILVKILYLHPHALFLR